MKALTLLRCLAFVAVLSLGAYPAAATDVDGPDDCQKAHEDMGDAPECIPAYPSGVLGRFPTCLAACPPGTQTFFCPPNSTPPGPTGFIRHLQSQQGFWLGCYSAPGGVLGIDTETNGKTNTPTVGSSACPPLPGILTDCVEPAFGMTFDQDECYADGSDAGVLADPGFVPCTFTGVPYNAYHCQPAQRQVFLNILVDWNADGDWNDNFQCSGACALEWPVKNVMVVLAPGCNALLSPPILAGPFNGPAWMRISLTAEPVLDDYPWNGSAGTASQSYQGGETEDYPVRIGQVTNNLGSSWGTLKTLYR